MLAITNATVTDPNSDDHTSEYDGELPQVRAIVVQLQLGAEVDGQEDAHSDDSSGVSRGESVLSVDEVGLGAGANVVTVVREPNVLVSGESPDRILCKERINIIQPIKPQN